MTHEQELRVSRNWRIGTVLTLCAFGATIIGTAIGYGRTIVTRDDMQQQMVPLYTRLNTQQDQIYSLQDELSRIDGELAAMRNDPPPVKGVPRKHKVLQ